MVSKLDLAIIGALAAGCALWVEHGHRVVIDAPTESELAAAAAAAACPGSDSVPYGARCLDFLNGAPAPGMGVSANKAAHAPASDPPRRGEVAPPAAPACPDRDNVPYSVGCLAFLQGATTTGMRWRVSAPEDSTPVAAPTAVADARAKRR